MTIEDMVEICIKFYREEEIIIARNVLSSLIDDRLPKRKGSEKLRLTLVDIVKTVVDPKYRHVLPKFYAVQLSRLPPVDIKHCDSAAVFHELHGLRQEVREVRTMQEELLQLRTQLSGFADMRSELQQLQVKMLELDAVHNELHQLQLKMQEMGALYGELQQMRVTMQGMDGLFADLKKHEQVLSASDFPTLNSTSPEVMACTGKPSAPLYATVASELNMLHIPPGNLRQKSQVSTLLWVNWLATPV